jgi:fused signal recognition particle receptor
MGFFDKIKSGLAKTRSGIASQIMGLFDSFTGANESFFEELEETLILADLGAELACETVEKLRQTARKEGIRGPEEIKRALERLLTEILDLGDCSLRTDTKPSVILVIGVNGVGKTTTIGKLAARYVREGRKVLLCAGDTFRAAAAEHSPFGPRGPGRTSSGMPRARTPARRLRRNSGGQSQGRGHNHRGHAGRLHNKTN